MTKSLDMRKLIDLANNNKIVSETYSADGSVESTPFKAFGSWGKLNESDVPFTVKYGSDNLPETMRFDDLDDAKAFAQEHRGRVLNSRNWNLIADYENEDEVTEGWDNGFPNTNDPVETRVWKDPQGDEWFWSKSRGGHTFDSRGGYHSEEEAHAAAGTLTEDEGDHMHLIRPRGGAECGAELHGENGTAEINDVTCPACIKGHDDYMDQFNHTDEGDGDGEGYDQTILDEVQDVHAQGEQAHHDGVKWWNNPHPSGSVKSYIWDQGHTAARTAPPKEEVLDEDDLELDRMFSGVHDEPIDSAKKQFAHFGFTGSPLSDEEIAKCHEMGVDPYGVGCDVNSGFSFEEALAANSNIVDEEAAGPEVDTVTGPSYWASYLINGDDSSLDPEEKAHADRWIEKLKPYYVVDVERDEDGDGSDPRFTWSYGLHSGTDTNGGDVVDYVVHKDTGSDHEPSRFDVLRDSGESEHNLGEGADGEWVVRMTDPKGQVFFAAHGGPPVTDPSDAATFSNARAAQGGVRTFSGTNDTFWNSERDSANSMARKYRGWKIEPVEMSELGIMETEGEDLPDDQDNEEFAEGRQ
jgi:hypothetical protein